MKVLRLIRECLPAAFVCGLVAILTAPVHGGFMLLFVVAVLAFWLPYSAFVIWRKPERRISQLIKVAMWVAMVSIVTGLHWHYAAAARRDADAVARAVLLYRQEHGSFPKDLKEAGLDDVAMRKRWMLGYGLDGDRPRLLYATTFTMFEAYTYDFAKGTWQYRPD